MFKVSSKRPTFAGPAFSFHAGLRFLDRIRAWWVVFLCSQPLGQKVFTNKAVRVSLGFSVSLIAASIVYLASPFWLLVITPMVVGPAHLWASFRYSTGLKHDRRNLAFLIVAMTLFLFFSALTMLSRWLPESPSWFNSRYIFASGLLTIYVATSPFSNSFSYLARFCCVLSVAFACIYWPYRTLVMLLIGHNVIAFYFWFQKASRHRNPAHLYVFLGCAVMCALMCLAICQGVFDPYLTKHRYEPWVLSLSSLFAMSPSFALRLVFVFGLTQSLHYFIWLRAIPELDIAGKAPPCWRQSYRLLKRDLGGLGSKFAIASCAFLICFFMGVTFYFSAQHAHKIYITIAGFHGFYEIAQIFSKPAT